MPYFLILLAFSILILKVFTNDILKSGMIGIKLCLSNNLSIREYHLILIIFNSIIIIYNYQALYLLQ